MTHALSTLTIALSLLGGAPVAHADGSLFVHDIRAPTTVAKKPTE